MARKQFLGKVASKLCRYPAGQNFLEIALSCTIPKINAFFAFYAEIQDWQENDF